ncbi:MAG TPA: FMN-binding negative transcriptional regulator [Bryobacteraceae bacterium]|nr:FMN-binding negative transcriptional regulator [Bryobacteraceae bacterium]
MYLPAHFREDRAEVLHEHMRRYPLATLVTAGPSGLIASHLPLILDPEPAPWGTLRGHLARANPQWRELNADVEALAIFTGPQAYVSPNWYSSKDQTGRVVPTWNYAVVHAYGPLSTYTDEERLRAHVTALTGVHEAGFDPAWTPDQAPREFIDGMLRAIVGIEIPIARLEGKWKVNQNRMPEDRAGVIAALESRGSAEDLEMAALIRERGNR